MFDLPLGKWIGTEKGTQICVEALADHTMRLNIKGPMDREPAVVDGPYTVTATKMGSYHVSFTVKHIHQKTLSNCRKNWYDRALEHTDLLSVKIAVGATLRLTLNYGCSASGKEHTQFCVHAERDGRPNVVCSDLTKEGGASCKPAPPIDGSQINPPAAPIDGSKYNQPHAPIDGSMINRSPR